jgi:hypothetical protein
MKQALVNHVSIEDGPQSESTKRSKGLLKAKEDFCSSFCLLLYILLTLHLSLILFHFLSFFHTVRAIARLLFTVCKTLLVLLTKEFPST